MPSKQVPFILSLAVRALHERGTIYVPANLADSPHLAGLENRGAYGRYVAFYRP
jgi:hypothetical protein